MNRLMGTFMIAAVLNARSLVAQTLSSTQTPNSAQAISSTQSPAATTPLQTGSMADAQPAAPMGHRQPHIRDVASEEAAAIERIDPESTALDRRLRICRGC